MSVMWGIAEVSRTYGDFHVVPNPAIAGHFRCLSFSGAFFRPASLIAASRRDISQQLPDRQGCGLLSDNNALVPTFPASSAPQRVAFSDRPKGPCPIPTQ